ncbi:MAG: arsenite methyltransferase [Caldilineaceae bacterium]
MKLEVLNPDEVRDQVREHYAERVRTAGSCCSPAPDTNASAASCCGPSCGPAAIDLESDGTWGVALYSADELAEVPEDAATVSYGCGNPTALASLKPGEVVLDLGSGGGIDCFLAARKVGEQGFVYGVDMTDEMLELARRNAVKAKVTNVEFRKGNIEALPLPDETVDVIISNCVVNLSPDKGEVLKDAFRVLRPGGRVAISDVVIDGDLSDLPVDEATVREALSWAGCIAGALTIDQFKQYLAEAGFEQIEIVVKHHYSLAELGQDVAGVTQVMPVALAEKLAARFTSSMIHARRPAR